MVLWCWRWVKRGAFALGIVLLTLLAVRAFDAWRGPPLELWHTVVPHELTSQQIDETDLAGYLAAEERVFKEVREKVTDQLSPEEQLRFNRYFENSAVYPGNFSQNFNRTFSLSPSGDAIGAAVFLHGLTDAPYSLRHLAMHYQARAFHALVIRLPGHGTVPGGLTDIDYESWQAAARLAMREARKLAGPGKPVHIIGYSNGGALALMHGLDALSNPALVAPDKIVLLSPMIGVTEFARFAGIAGWPAIFPAFAKAAWLSILPEFNPFKYNSFPVNAARESYQLTQALQTSLQRHVENGQIARLAPVLTFQSVLDHTVSTRAVIRMLHERLPDNGSELVLFDVNRNTHFEQLLNARADTALSRLLPLAPRQFRTSVVTNSTPGSDAMEVQVTPAGSTDTMTRPLGLAYPPDVYSLSHVAVPFPLSDGLYGLEPDSADYFGVRLGDVAARGEYGALIVNIDMLLRMSSNPFFPYLLERLDADLPSAPARQR